MTQPRLLRHSSYVRMSLHVGGQQFDVVRLGPESLELREACTTSFGYAELYIHIDDETEIVPLILGGAKSENSRELLVG